MVELRTFCKASYTRTCVLYTVCQSPLKLYTHLVCYDAEYVRSKQKLISWEIAPCVSRRLDVFFSKSQVLFF